MTAIMVFTDGACSNNGNTSAQGGWGAVLINAQGQRLELAGPLSGDNQTSNRAELTAAIEGLSALKRPSSVILTTDSRYVEQGCREWLPKWQSNGWKSSNGKPVKNQDLWQQMAELLKLHTVELRWVRGHTGHPENERADTLATMGAAGKRIRRRSKRKAA
jgi:ribonuclease HI